MVHELRYLISRERIPIVVGLDLFPSINNPYARRTGRVTLPFGNERSFGGHAMLVVGYDDSEGSFLVRNSWGTGWAYENPWQANGHAIIPYAYFQRYSQRAYTMRYMHQLDNVDVPEARRLYNRRRSGSGGLAVADKSRLTGSSAVAINRTPRQNWTIKPPKVSILRRIFRLLAKTDR